MKTLRRIHVAGIILSGSSLGLALCGMTRASVALLAATTCLQFFSLEALRALTTNQPWSK
ncbi:MULTISPECIES: hypothetical protein [unclassified Sphingomonas]|uniref:hypothetical protein n=1 Tax=unclassified Sphingomonas TaxID=196159 RepID=UPI00226A22C7|nr:MULTISPECIES: hypothetical protein [unclassified Sphingomonas]